MKKLLGLLLVGALLAMITGCPPAPTTEGIKPPPVKPPPDKTSPAAPTETTVKGTVTKAEKDKLTIKDDAGKEQGLAVTADTKITLDGKDEKAENLKPDSTVTVTKKGDAVAKIEAKSPAAPAAAETTVKGTVTKAEKDKLTIKDDAGKEQLLPVTADTKITLDGKDEKVENLKPDSTIIATKKGDAVTKIEAKAPAAPPPPAETTLSGKVTKAEKDKVTFKDADGKDQTAAVGADTKVTIDGKDGKAEDIKPDSTVTVAKKGDAVAKIDAKSPAAPPPPDAPKPVSGKVSKAEAGKITLSVDGKDNAFDVPDTAKVTIDGKDAKAADLKDLKPDDKTTATITSDKDGKTTAVEVKTK